MANKRKLKYGKEDRWEVDFGYDADGHRQRPWFKSEKEANKAISDRAKLEKRAGDWWCSLTKLERMTIQTVVQAIKQEKTTLSAVWEDWQRWQKDNAQNCTTPTPYIDAIPEWRQVKIRAGKSEEYCDGVESVLRKFGEGREQIPIHRIAPKELDDWIHSHEDWSNTTKRTYQSYFSSLWEVAKMRGFCSMNILDRCEVVQRDPIDKVIWKNERITQFLAALMLTKNPAVLPNVCQIFCCMRPDESTHPDFNWDLIDLEHRLIDLRSSIAKKADQRVIRVQPTGVKWLKLCKEWDIQLPAVNERKNTDLACRIIGLVEWDRDGLRKTCLTHLRPVYRNDYDVVKDGGNSARILIENYAELHTPEDISFAFWKIDPDAVEAYMKTPEWEALLRSSSATSSSPPTPKANASAKPAD